MTIALEKAWAFILSPVPAAFGLQPAAIRLILASVAGCGGPLLRADDSARNFRIPSLYHVGYWVRDLGKVRAFYEQYLGFEEPYLLNHPDGTLQLVVMKINERQVIYLFPDATKIKPNGDNLDHLGLLVDNAAALHADLIARGVKVSAPHFGRIGDLIVGVTDPDGNPYEVTQLEPQGQLLQHQGKSLPPTRISSHLLSATLAVANLPAAVAFYRDSLGFKEIGTVGGPSRLQVPDGTDYVELVLANQKPDAPGARSVPQFTLVVPDAAKAAETLAGRARSGEFPAPAPVSTAPDGRRQTSVVDPDGTRIILTE
jgi:catechol 2,3-dioxygenase-like lactoylglutathione lyase family enzyme